MRLSWREFGSLGVVGALLAAGCEDGVDVASRSAAATVTAPLLNEVKINPAGGDQPFEYIELRGVAGSALTDLYVVAIEGDASGGTTPDPAPAGVADLVVSLGAASFGTNELLVIQAPAGGHTPAAATTVVTDTQFVAPGNPMENGTISILLVRSATALVEGTDYDANGDGVLELPDGAVVLDAVAVTDGGTIDITYGGVVITQETAVPGGLTRFVENVTPLSAAAWYGGVLTGANSDVAYDSVLATNRTANFPAGGAMTPGDVNVPAGASGLVDAGPNDPDAAVDAAIDAAIDAAVPPIDAAVDAAVPPIDAAVDAAPLPPDAAPQPDATVTPRPDAGSPDQPDESCDCRVGGRSRLPSGATLLGFGLVLGLFGLRRRRARR